MNSFETWHYFNGAYIAHGKQWITNGVVSHNVEFSSAAGKWDYDKDDVLDEDSEFCKRVIFSSSTYLCFYVDGTARCLDGIGATAATAHCTIMISSIRITQTNGTAT